MREFDDVYIDSIVEKYADTIVRVSFQYTKNKADAEDIMQEVFLSLLKQPPFNDEEHLKAWLIRVAINKSKNYLKAAKRRNLISFDGLENIFSVTQVMEVEELWRLPEKDRELIFLYYYEGYSVKEVAKILRSREKAVFMRLSRARQRLKYLLLEE